MFNFKHTRISLNRSLTDYSKIQWLIAKVRRNNRLFPPKVQPGSYLNVGCGPDIAPDFLNIDYDWRPGVDICWDIARPFPIAAGVIGGIYTEHCLEHLPFESARAFLADCFRMMQQGARIRIVVPDLELYARAYVEWLDGRVPTLPNVNFSNKLPINQPVALINELFYGPTHRFMYDYPTLAEVLASVGFSDIAKRSIGQGADSRLLIDHARHATESVYVEARRA